MSFALNQEARADGGTGTAVYLAGGQSDLGFTDTIHERLELSGFSVARLGTNQSMPGATAYIAVLSASENAWFAQDLSLIQSARKPLLVIALADIELPPCLASYRCRDKNVPAALAWLQGILNRAALPYSPPSLPTTSSAFWDRKLALASDDLARAAASVFPLVGDGKVQGMAVAISPDLVIAADQGLFPVAMHLQTPAGDLAVQPAGPSKGIAPFRVATPLAVYVRLAETLPADPTIVALSGQTLSPGWVTQSSDWGLQHDASVASDGAALLSLATGELVGLQNSKNPEGMSAVAIRSVLRQLNVPLAVDAGVLEAAGEDDFLERAAPQDYSGRKGYDAKFLGPAVPLPVTSKNVADLKYTNFTVGLQPSRKMALYTAVNINGRKRVDIKRSVDRWLIDPRVPADEQIGGAYYRGTPLDRGHMVRRVDPVWGPDSKQAELDTFHYSNACPQHKDLNRKTWNDLEDYIYDNTGKEDLKVTVFTGPVLRNGDSPFHGAQLPEEFWKVVVMRRDDGKLSATAYLLSQQDMIQGLEFVFGQFRTYQVPVALIEKRTGLDFGDLRKFDPKAKAGSLESAAALNEVRGALDLDLGLVAGPAEPATPAPSWQDLSAGESQLRAALNTFDWATVQDLTQSLIRQISNDPTRLDAPSAKRILSALRNKRRFAQMTRVGDSFIQAGVNAHQVRRQYAQALIDQGVYYAAELVLRSILADSTAPAIEREEAQGLLGRTFKQIYIDAGAPNAQQAAHLQSALNSYWLTYALDPGMHTWQGINVVAIVMRGSRDGIQLSFTEDPKTIARNILSTLEQKESESRDGQLDAWDTATAIEAHLALGEYDKVIAYAKRYVDHQEADAFEIASTLRQFEQVWQLRDDKPPGDVLLPILRSALLLRDGGVLKLSAASALFNYEKVFGNDGSVALGWYQDGLSRARSVARIEINGKGFGTGWLADSKDFFPDQAQRPLLVTNAHVIGPDTSNRHPGALRPEDAKIRFQMQQLVTTGRVLFHSPVTECDATFLELDVLPADTSPLPLDFTNLIVKLPPQRLYIIGHPGGRDLEFSLQDNHLLAANERLVHYRTPSEGGSSGSPVFGPVGWNVLALHHAGRKDMPRIDGQPGTYEANEGIALAALREKTRQKPSQT